MAGATGAADLAGVAGVWCSGVHVFLRYSAVRMGSIGSGSVRGHNQRYNRFFLRCTAVCDEQHC